MLGPKKANILFTSHNCSDSLNMSPPPLEYTVCILYYSITPDNWSNSSSRTCHWTSLRNSSKNGKKTSKFASPKEMSHGFPGGFPMDFPWIWVPRLLQRLVEELPETARLHTEAVLQLIGQILEEDGRKTPTWLVGGWPTPLKNN